MQTCNTYWLQPCCRTDRCLHVGALGQYRARGERSDGQRGRSGRGRWLEGWKQGTEMAKNRRLGQGKRMMMSFTAINGCGPPRMHIFAIRHSMCKPRSSLLPYISRRSGPVCRVRYAAGGQKLLQVGGVGMDMPVWPATHDNLLAPRQEHASKKEGCRHGHN